MSNLTWLCAELQRADLHRCEELCGRSGRSVQAGNDFEQLEPPIDRVQQNLG